MTTTIGTPLGVPKADQDANLSGGVQAHGQMFVSAIVPARNEAQSVGAVIRGLLAQRTVKGQQRIAEVVVADNGSTDETAAVAAAAGARVINVPVAGYGNACWEAVQASRGEYLLFVDGDGAANPAEAGRLLAGLEQGSEMVIGVRTNSESDAMTIAQRFGNALACGLVRWIWQMPATDLGPYRAIRRDAFDALDMQDRSFGWTVEMQVRAHLLGIRVSEVAVGWRARTGGVSKISGTARGVLSAGFGILGMIADLWWRERSRPNAHPHRRVSR